MPRRFCEGQRKGIVPQKGKCSRRTLFVKKLLNEIRLIHSIFNSIDSMIQFKLFIHAYRKSYEGINIVFNLYEYSYLQECMNKMKALLMKTKI